MANDKPKPEPKPAPEGKSGPTDMALFVSTVLAIQEKIGQQTNVVETLNGYYMAQREDIRTLEKIIEAQGLEFKTSIKSLNRTMYLGWALLLAIGAAVIWMVLRVWEILLPFLQLKLGLPTK